LAIESPGTATSPTSRRENAGNLDVKVTVLHDRNPRAALRGLGVPVPAVRGVPCRLKALGKTTGDPKRRIAWLTFDPRPAVGAGTIRARPVAIVTSCAG